MPEITINASELNSMQSQMDFRARKAAAHALAAKLDALAAAQGIDPAVRDGRDRSAREQEDRGYCATEKLISAREIDEVVGYFSDTPRSRYGNRLMFDGR